jgi:hypothetical protein
MMALFGLEAAKLQSGKPQAWLEFRRAVRLHGLDGKTRRPGRQDVERVLAKPVPLRGGGELAGVIGAAVNAQLLRKGIAGGSEGIYFNISRKANLKEQATRLENIVNRLDGGAFEAFVDVCLRTGSRFCHYLHSVMPATATEESDFGETDFVAFEPQQMSLNVISCKSSPPSLEHLEAIKARTEKLGGRFAKGILCVENVSPQRLDTLRVQATRLGLGCFVGTEIPAAFGCLNTVAPATP